MNPLTTAAETGTEVSPGILGFLVVAALGLTLYFLVRSMNKQISRIEAPREDDYARAQREARDRDDGHQESPRRAAGNADSAESVGDNDNAEGTEDTGNGEGAGARRHGE